MPSAGLPIESFIKEDTANEETQRIRNHIYYAAKTAISYGMFNEWLESFVGAWNATKDPRQAADAGLIEWDM
jgi:hypothetical protein